MTDTGSATRWSARGMQPSARRYSGYGILLGSAQVCKSKSDTSRQPAEVIRIRTLRDSPGHSQCDTTGKEHQRTPGRADGKIRRDHRPEARQQGKSLRNIILQTGEGRERKDRHLPLHWKQDRQEVHLP